MRRPPRALRTQSSPVKKAAFQLSLYMCAMVRENQSQSALQARGDSGQFPLIQSQATRLRINRNVKTESKSQNTTVPLCCWKRIMNVHVSTHQTKHTKTNQYMTLKHNATQRPRMSLLSSADLPRSILATAARGY